LSDNRSTRSGQSVESSLTNLIADFFELAPDAQGLFRGDMERQYLKLMDMIAAIVGTLDKREMFQSIIGHSGRQHAQFGAKPMHFAAFGDALIWGLEQQFGAAFTPEMKGAWIKLYDDVQREMVRAGRTSEDVGVHTGRF
jgi:hemoglobin-like flavoprotein